MFNYQSFIAKLKSEPDNAEALWGLFNCYENGWGVSADSGIATGYLKRAAQAGSIDAKLKLDLREQTQKFTQMFQKEQPARDLQAAEDLFRNKIGLVEAIHSQILPTLVTIKTANGRVGTGFFQHTEWLVSNAHVLPYAELLEITTLIDMKGESLPLNVHRAFHRPFHQDTSPDIAIIKTNSRNPVNRFAPPCTFLGDEACKETYFFYYDLSDNKIKYLRPCSPVGVYPIRYRHEDATDPMPGSSGSPIIQARVVLGKTPTWQFNVVGALYARCNSQWHNQYTPADFQVPLGAKLVCAIPVLRDFDQIHKNILDIEDMGERAAQSSKFCKLLGDAQAKADAAAYLKSSEAHKVLAALGLKEYEAGKTELNIDLPEDLEKLWYQGIVSIKDSLLVDGNLQAVLGKSASKAFSRVPQVPLEVLESDFRESLGDLRKIDAFALRKGDGCYISPQGYFRIDILGGSTGYWMLQFQDNTGKDSSGKPYKYLNKSLSSIFAIVKLPAGNKFITGVALAKLVRKSQKYKIEKELGSLTEKDESDDEAVKRGDYGSFFMSASGSTFDNGYDGQTIFTILNAAFQYASDTIDVKNTTYLPFLPHSQAKFIGDITTAIQTTSEKKRLFLIDTTHGANQGTHWIGMVIKLSDDQLYVELFDSASDADNFDPDYDGLLANYHTINPNPQRPITEIVKLILERLDNPSFQLRVFRTYQQNGDLHCGIWVVANLLKRAYDDDLYINRDLLPDHQNAVDIRMLIKEQEGYSKSEKQLSK